MLAVDALIANAQPDQDSRKLFSAIAQELVAVRGPYFHHEMTQTVIALGSAGSAFYRPAEEGITFPASSVASELAGDAKVPEGDRALALMGDQPAIGARTDGAYEQAVVSISLGTKKAMMQALIAEKASPQQLAMAVDVLSGLGAYGQAPARKPSMKR